MILLMYEPVPEHYQKLKDNAGDHEIRWASSEYEARELIREAEIVMGNQVLFTKPALCRQTPLDAIQFGRG